MDEGENRVDVLQVNIEDKKGKWNSFRRGKKQIAKLWKSRKRSKAVDEGGSEEDDDGSEKDYEDDERPTMSPDSAASSNGMDRVPSITLQRPSVSIPSSPDSIFLDVGATTEDDDHYSSGRENQIKKSVISKEVCYSQLHL